MFDANGVLAHATTVTLTITLPDGTTATPAIGDTAVPGQYRLAYQTTIPGRYTAHAVTSGPVASWDDEFDAAPTPWPTMVYLADAKSQLNMDVTDHRFDDELRDFIASATGAAEPYKHEVIVRRTVTDELDLPRLGWYGYAYGGLRRQKFWLHFAPGDLPDLRDLLGRRERRGMSPRCGAAPSGVVRVMNGPPVSGIVVVTYIAGYSRIPPHYKRGALV